MHRMPCNREMTQGLMHASSQGSNRHTIVPRFRARAATRCGWQYGTTRAGAPVLSVYHACPRRMAVRNSLVSRRTPILPGDMAVDELASPVWRDQGFDSTWFTVPGDGPLSAQLS
jgi:hypothetical protein